MNYVQDRNESMRLLDKPWLVDNSLYTDKKTHKQPKTNKQTNK